MKLAAQFPSKTLTLDSIIYTHLKPVFSSKIVNGL